MDCVFFVFAETAGKMNLQKDPTSNHQVKKDHIETSGKSNVKTSTQKIIQNHGKSS